MSEKHEVTILVVDDDEVDREAVRRSFKRAKIANPVVEAHDGLDALETLKGENGKEKLTSPFIILLDLNMPRMNGIEFLDALRQDEELQTAIVFVLTTSKAEEDKMKAYRYNVAGYVVKSDLTSEFLRAVTMLDHYWKVVELPPEKM